MGVCMYNGTDVSCEEHVKLEDFQLARLRFLRLHLCAGDPIPGAPESKFISFITSRVGREFSDISAARRAA